MKISRFNVFVLVLALAMSLTTPAGASSTVTVKPSDINGWGILPTGNVAVTTNNATGKIVVGPGGQPGSLLPGSVEYKTNSSPGGKPQLYAPASLTGVKFTDLSELSYSTYISQYAAGGSHLVHTVNVKIDLDGSLATTTDQYLLVYEPCYSTSCAGAIQPLNTWATWNAMAPGAIWWSTGSIPGTTFIVPSNSFAPLASIYTAYPDAVIYFILFQAGQGSGGMPWNDFIGNLDGITIGISGNNTTYDFEPETPCTTVCYADANNGNNAFGGDTPDNAKKTIQAALDAVSPSGIVRVLPGNYNETATNRYVLGTNGPHQFGLFIDKNGVTIQGVSVGDDPLTDYNALQAYVTTNATNNFGASGIFVEGDNVTIAGLRIGPNLPGDNKTIEIIGDGFTLKDSHVDVPGGGSVYFGDWQFDTGTNTSHIQTYTIDHNLIDQSTSIDITSGAGYTGDPADRHITNNEFENSEYWPSISFNGSGTGVPWFVQSVGGAVIEDNTFTNTFNGTNPTAGHIRVRGDVAVAQFDWTAYWNNNTFNKAVVILEGAYPPFNVREYNYLSGSYSFDVRRIGVNIQGSVDKASANDTILVKAGTYVEQVAVNKSLTLLGESGAASTFITAPSTIPVASNPESNIVKITGSGVNVDISGFTVTGPGPSGCGSIGTGIFVRDGAYANIHNNQILDVRDNPFSGCQNGVAIQIGRASLSTSGTADISNNLIADYQKNGVTVSNIGSSATVESNTITGAGATTVIAQNGVQVSGGATAEINGNAISNHSYSPGSYTSTGMLIYGSDADTYSNTMSENQSGIYHIEGSGVHEANILNVTTAGTGSPYLYGFVIDAPPPGLTPAPFEDESMAVPALLTIFSTLSSTPVQDVDILNNELTGDGTSASYGIGAYGGFGTMDIDLTVKNNKITNFGTGLDIYQCTVDCTTGVFSSVVVNLNSITGNTDYGLLNTDAIPVNAEMNWWNNVSGPAPTGSGDEVGGDVDFTPWLCSGVDTSPDAGFQPNITTLCPYQFLGFFQPIDMTAVNIAKAGQSIPVKWRLLDALGNPISDPSSFIKLVSYPVACGTYTGDPADAIEEYTSGTSGLQYNGDGYWQFNWKTPKFFAGTCRKMYIQFQGGFMSPEVIFQFK